MKQMERVVSLTMEKRGKAFCYIWNSSRRGSFLSMDLLIGAERIAGLVAGNGKGFLAAGDSGSCADEFRGVIC